MQRIDFWFSIGSTYTYLTVMRLDSWRAGRAVDIVPRPFNVRDVMVEQKNIPFQNKPIKTAYMWRDIERRARMYDLPVRVPAPYPLKNLPLANQIALLGMNEGWGWRYVVETYRHWFQEGLPAGEEENLQASLAHVGESADSVVARAQSPEVAGAHDRSTDEAKGQGVFGSPTFAVGREIFWGDDRLEDAAKWARDGHLG